MPSLDIAAETSGLLTEIRAAAGVASSLRGLQEEIVAAIAQRLTHYHWTGFYMLDPADPETLVLEAFAGDPTPHVRIPVSQGICGAAAATGQTVVVDDVNQDRRYLSCSIKTKSEIVVPIYARGSVIGEIDIDSHAPAAFKGVDQAFLEETARIVGAWVESHPRA
jgi:GAF domain-containing protein